MADAGFEFGAGARFTARLLQTVIEHGLPPGLLLNVNVPARRAGRASTTLGRRIYRDSLERGRGPRAREGLPHLRRRPHHDEQPGSDFEAVADGLIAVTPLHFDLAVRDGDGWLYDLDLGALL